MDTQSESGRKTRKGRRAFMLPIAPQMHEALRAEAKRRGTSMCDVVRAAIAVELRRSRLAHARAEKERAEKEQAA